MPALCLPAEGLAVRIRFRGGFEEVWPLEAASRDRLLKSLHIRGGWGSKWLAFDSGDRKVCLNLAHVSVSRFAAISAPPPQGEGLRILAAGDAEPLSLDVDADTEVFDIEGNCGERSVQCQEMLVDVDLSLPGNDAVLKVEERDGSVTLLLVDDVAFLEIPHSCLGPSREDPATA